ncbi:geranylgeranyl diphosphate synthase type I [Lentzea atacamensis]|uniref:Geranylgeranyl diphosphate synthase type I n=1 Tax=Lentzea atacamensis TaxID=531938 RepID=A0A316HE07_9PSEU|nr:family 2 encapsulin nanocompartment cargo protein polyprenyl transferase [Lentzea atacamensis]PWK78617.1 geranylgeranyl diphosphate synthase type I [Lentzea atacamensis]
MSQPPHTVHPSPPRETNPSSPLAARQILGHVRTVVDPALRAAVNRLPDSVRRVAGYHFGWWDEHGRSITTDSGKAVRPALALLATQAVGGTAACGLPAAVAVELVHNASLLHDDIIDRDATRRHRPTAWSAFGVPAAILAGDALFFLSIHILSTAPAPLSTQGLAFLEEAVQQLIDGEYTDTAFEHRTEVTLAQCQAMAQAKTSTLIACACALGALAGGANPTQTDHLRSFGHHLGIAFQLVDDLMGIWGDPAHTGKPHLSDLRAHKKSLPVVAALTTPCPASQELASLYHQNTPLTEHQLQHAATLIEAAGGRDWATRQADHHLTTALHHLTAADLADHPAAQLATLAHMIIQRNH